MLSFIAKKRIQFECFRRDDSLWDIEATLLDFKPYAYDDRERGALPPEHPIHDFTLRVTLGDDLVVRDVECLMRHTPFHFCGGAIEPMRAVIGLSISAGWRREIDRRLSGVAGCSHLRELLYAVATPAFQAISTFREQFAPEVELPKGADGMPFFLGKCHSWALNSPVVERFYPQFFASETKSDSPQPAVSEKLTKGTLVCDSVAICTERPNEESRK